MIDDRKFGPVGIHKKLNDNAYVLDLPQDYQFSSTFNVSDLYDYYSPDGIENSLEGLVTNLSQVEDNWCRGFNVYFKFYIYVFAFISMSFMSFSCHSFISLGRLCVAHELLASYLFIYLFVETWSCGCGIVDVGVGVNLLSSRKHVKDAANDCNFLELSFCCSSNETIIELIWS